MFLVMIPTVSNEVAFQITALLHCLGLYLFIKHYVRCSSWASQVAQWQRIHLPLQAGSSLGWEDPLEKEMITHSSILAWEMPWGGEPGWPQSMGSQGVVHD